MKDRSAVRSRVWSIFCLVFVGLFDRTNQRPLCTSSTQCEDNSLSFEDERPLSDDHLYVRALDDPDVMKQLLEAIVIQHKSIIDTTGNAVDYEENSTKRPPIGVDVEENFHSSSTGRQPAFNEAIQQNKIESKSIAEDATNSEDASATEQPLMEGSLPEIEQDPISSEKDDSPWEVTTIEPQPLVSPLTVEEYHFETTTLQPGHSAELISSENSVGQFESTTNSPMETDKKKDILPLYVTPTKFFKKKTKRPHIHPTTAPPVKGHEKIKRKPTTMPEEKMNPPVTVAKRQEQAGEIQLLPRKDPIRITKPTAGPSVMRETETATSKRPDKKPINIIPRPVNKVGQGQTEGFAGQPQGTGISNPTANPVAVASNKPDDDLISMLASIAGVDDTEEDDEDENDEEDDKQEESDEEDDDSADENEERENYDYIDPAVASDVISRVMEEVSALI